MRVLAEFLWDEFQQPALDFLDIVFKLEQTFHIQITRGEMERAARGDMSEDEFAPGGVISEAGLARLRELMGATDPAKPQSWNRYAYVENDPMAATDPTGLLLSHRNDPDWYESLNWSEAGQLNNGNPDAGGNVVFFLIHRMCAIPNCDTSATCGGKPNTCASTLSTSALALQGSDQTRPTDSHSTAPAFHYRVTAKAVGPRNSISIVQSMVRAFN